jgi:hypothetical protein
MHPSFREAMMRHQGHDLDRNVRTAYLWRERPLTSAVPTEPVLLRLCCVQDDAALERLAALEGRPTPQGRHVVAEVGGVVVAALPLGSGSPFADPFRPTAHLIPLLELRAKQLSDGRPRRGFALRGSVRALGRA